MQQTKLFDFNASGEIKDLPKGYLDNGLIMKNPRYLLFSKKSVFIIASLFLGEP